MSISDVRDATLPEAPAVSPESIMRIASGFMAAKHLFAANQLGVFEALGNAPATLDTLASRIQLTRRATRICADAMVAVGLLERKNDLYCNTPAANMFLSGRSPDDLRAALRFWDRISYPAWSELSTALTGRPKEQITELNGSSQAIAAAGIESITNGAANALGSSVDLTAYEKLLDIGGGTGSWSMALTSQYVRLRSTIVELPSMIDVARARIGRSELTDRISVLAGDALEGELPPGHDVALLANLAHYFSAQQNRQVLDRLRHVTAPHAKLMLADFWTNRTHTEPLIAALMAGEFASLLSAGDVYSVDEVRSWLADTGWNFVDHIELAGPISVITAAKAGA